MVFKAENLNLKDDNRSGAFTNFDDNELKELFNENPIQTQEELTKEKELTKRLGITRQAVSIRLKQSIK